MLASLHRSSRISRCHGIHQVSSWHKATTNDDDCDYKRNFSSSWALFFVLSLSHHCAERGERERRKRKMSILSPQQSRVSKRKRMRKKRAMRYILLNFCAWTIHVNVHAIVCETFVFVVCALCNHGKFDYE